MTPSRRAFLAAPAAAPIVCGLPARAAAETVRIAVQPGMTYLALNMMRHRKLLEKHAPGIAPEYVRLLAGNNVNDAMIAGAVDIGATGAPAFLSISPIPRPCSISCRGGQ